MASTVIKSPQSGVTLCFQFVSARWCHNTGTFGFVLWQLNNVTNLTLHVPHIPQYNIHNKNASIFVLKGVLCDMGHVHCGIYENSLFIISSGLAWCHHAPDLCLASNGHGRLPNKLERNPTTLIFLAGRGGSEASSLAAPPLWDGTGSSQHRATKHVVGKLFQFSTDWNQIWYTCWVIRVNDHPPTLTKIKQL